MLLAIIFVAVILAVFPVLTEQILGENTRGFNSVADSIVRILGG